MKYMLLIYGNHDAWNAITPEFAAQIGEIHQELRTELTRSGELLETHELSITEAATVRSEEDDETLVTDGPFAEAKEILAGYYLVDCASLARATEIASRFAEARFAPIEVRQISLNPRV